jgi:polar amino acid transport system substrate-binding protein
MIVAILCLIVGAGVASAEDTVYVDGIDAAFPPFSYIDESGNPTGFDVEVMQWIASEMGFDIDIVPIDWDAIIPTLLAGEIDLIASGMTITAQRAVRVSFTEPYWSVDLAIVVQQDEDEDGEPVPEFNLFTVVQSGNRIGVQRGTTSQTWLQENVVDAGIDIELVLYDNFLLTLEDLEIGRIDGAIMDAPTASSSISDRPLTIVGTIATGEIYGYAVRPEDDVLLSLLNEGLQRIQSSGIWDELVQKWLTGD